LAPHLCVERAAEAIGFYTAVLGATERMRLTGTDGRVRHAELAVGDSLFVVWDEDPAAGVASPRSFGGSPVTLALYVEDVDAVIEAAVRAGARVLIPRRTGSTGTGWAGSRTPTATGGSSPPTSRTSRRTRSRAGRRPKSPPPRSRAALSGPGR
jgi:uncharacterized glyoxalase superfamily protein PhnB